MLAHEAPEADAPRDVFVYDPEVPVLAPGVAQAMAGPFDQSVLEMGNNLLVYTSAPVERETEIFGQPIIKLYAATSAPHADFTAKLVRVTPAGKSGVPLHRHRAQFLALCYRVRAQIKSTSGSSRLNPLPLSLPPVNPCALKSRALRFRSTIAILPLHISAPARGSMELGAFHPADPAFPIASRLPCSYP